MWLRLWHIVFNFSSLAYFFREIWKWCLWVSLKLLKWLMITFLLSSFFSLMYAMAKYSWWAFIWCCSLYLFLLGTRASLPQSYNYSLTPLPSRLCDFLALFSAGLLFQLAHSAALSAAHTPVCSPGMAFQGVPHSSITGSSGSVPHVTQPWLSLSPSAQLCSPFRSHCKSLWPLILLWYWILCFSSAFSRSCCTSCHLLQNLYYVSCLNQDPHLCSSWILLSARCLGWGMSPGWVLLWDCSEGQEVLNYQKGLAGCKAPEASSISTGQLCDAPLPRKDPFLREVSYEMT